MRDNDTVCRNIEDRLRQVQRSRDLMASAKAALAEHKAALREQAADLLDKIAAREDEIRAHKADVAAARARLQEYAVELYRTTGEKQLYNGAVTVTEPKEKNVTVPDPDAALEWAKEKGLALQLDIDAFCSLARLGAVPEDLAAVTDPEPRIRLSSKVAELWEGTAFGYTPSEGVEMFCDDCGHRWRFDHTYHCPACESRAISELLPF